jgi:5-methylcytosine-specific restriction endonuclease McrA
MPSKKIPCPQCEQPMGATSKMCRKCQPSYERTPEMNAKMSAATKGKPKPSLKGRKRPKVGRKIAAWWTPERREARRQQLLGRNPQARYHGLSARSAARLVQRIGHCERCQHDGSDSRLGVHHRNRDKHDHRLENIEILCHRCHMQEHAAAGETGIQIYHRKRKTLQG